MPRPKPNNASPSFMIQWHRLSPDVEVKLLELLGHSGYESGPRFPVFDDPESALAISDVPDEKRILAKIENALGLYITGEPHLDNIPRPAHYIRAFEPIRRDAYDLFMSLQNLGGYFRNQIAESGGDVAVIEAALLSLVQVSDTVKEKYSGLSSKGAPKNVALTETIKRLRYIFRSHYKGKATGRTTRGAFQNFGDEEQRELNFVEIAFVDAKIIPQTQAEIGKWKEKLKALFRDPRCAMPQERAVVVERIANKANRPRRKKRNS